MNRKKLMIYNVDPSSCKYYGLRTDHTTFVNIFKLLTVDSIFVPLLFRHVFPQMKNPMDFEFFMSVVRSDDEASRQTEWQHLRNKLAVSGVTPSLTLQDLHKETLEDPTRYLTPNHLKLMSAKLSEIQLSCLVVRLMRTITDVSIR